jgi:hypothetical protein
MPNDANEPAIDLYGDLAGFFKFRWANCPRAKREPPPTIIRKRRIRKLSWLRGHATDAPETPASSNFPEIISLWVGLGLLSA